MTQVAVSEDIKSLLGTNSFGVDGTDLFAYEWGSAIEGDEVDKQTLILDDDSIDSDLKECYEQPVFVIMVRGDRNEGGKIVRDIARAIWEFLIAQPTQTINGTDYLEFEPIGGMIPLGKDKNKRFVYSMSFFTFRDPI